jgi:hypothetical protein
VIQGYEPSRGCEVTLFSRPTLDNFIVGEESRAAHLAAFETGKNPGKRYNPLFIYGGNGYGKSHLLNAIAGEISDNDPSTRVYIGTYNAFSALLKDSTVTGDNTSVNDLLSSIDVFLLDDLQNDDMWLSFQKELIVWFDRFIQEEKQVILTSDRPLLQLLPLEGRFLSQVQHGLIIPLGEPDRSVKEGVVSLLMEREGLEIDVDSLSCLGGLPVSHVRELEGILNRIVVSLKAEGNELTRSWLEKMLNGMMDRGEIRKLELPRPAEVVPRETERKEPVVVYREEDPVLELEELPGTVVADSIVEKEIEKELEKDTSGELEEEELEELEEDTIEELEREVIGELEEDSGLEGDGKEKVSVIEADELIGLDESEGLIMDWDREEDRLLNEL